MTNRLTVVLAGAVALALLLFGMEKTQAIAGLPSWVWLITPLALLLNFCAAFVSDKPRILLEGFMLLLLLPAAGLLTAVGTDESAWLIKATSWYPLLVAFILAGRSIYVLNKSRRTQA